jgi:hypothetical protein
MEGEKGTNEVAQGRQRWHALHGARFRTSSVTGSLMRTQMGTGAACAAQAIAHPSKRHQQGNKCPMMNSVAGAPAARRLCPAAAAAAAAAR